MWWSGDIQQRNGIKPWILAVGFYNTSRSKFDQNFNNGWFADTIKAHHQSIGGQ